MRVSRIETVIQFVIDQQASSRWYARLLDVEPTPYAAPYFKFDEHAYLILAPRRLVTLNDPDGNIVGLIDNSKDGMPGQRA